MELLLSDCCTPGKKTCYAGDCAVVAAVESEDTVSEVSKSTDAEHEASKLATLTDEVTVEDVFAAYDELAAHAVGVLDISEDDNSYVV